MSSHHKRVADMTPEELEHEREMGRRKYARNPEAKLASVRKWKASHVAEVKESQHNCYIKNRGVRLANTKAWRLAHPYESRLYGRRHRAKRTEEMRQAENSYTVVQSLKQGATAAHVQAIHNEATRDFNSAARVAQWAEKA